MTITYNKQVIVKRGNTAVNSTYTGPIGELTYDTDSKIIRVHDGVNVGGTALANKGDVDAANAAIANTTIWGNYYGQGGKFIGADSLTFFGNDSAVLGGLNNGGIVGYVSSRVAPIQLSSGACAFMTGQPTDINDEASISIAVINELPFQENAASIINPITDTWGNVYIRARDPSIGGAIYNFSNVGLFTPSSIIPYTDNAVDLGTPTQRFRHLYVAPGTIYLGNIKLSDTNGKLEAKKVINPGEEDEQEDPENSDAFSDVRGGGTSTTLAYLNVTNDPFIFNPYVGDAVTFTKTDNGNEVDEIDTSLAITRGVNQGIYNPYLEPNWDDTSNDGPSPAGTLWNKDGWGDLTNLNQRIYLSFYDTFLRFGNNVLPAEAVMKDVANNKYYKFDFTVWGNANQGAPVTYTRTQIDGVTGDPIGDPVTFEKTGYADPTQVNDPIDTGLVLARANQYSIYNIALEAGYNNVGDGQDSPEGTLWNAEGWGTLRDVTSRTYGTFLETLDYAIGNNILNKELVMHDTINNKYYAFKFSSWTPNNNGGGFEYTRQEINTSNLFIKPDNDTSTIDIFVPDDGEGSGIGITRDTYNGIYNPYREGSWADTVSPGGTLWNIEGWDDLSDITTRDYKPFYEAFGRGGLGNKVPGTKTVMYIPETDQYYAIHWLSWKQSGGGGFSYIRYEIDPTKVNEGVIFPDGTILKSAEGLGRVKSVASRGRRIEEVTGNKTVTVTPRATTTITTVASRSVENNYLIWLDYTTTTIDDIINSYPSYGINSPYDMEFSVDNITWYPWVGSAGSDGNEYGYSIFPNQVTYNQGDTIYFRYIHGGQPVVWWDKVDLPGGSDKFRGAVIDYHAYTGDATIIGTVHIVSDTGSNHVTHTEVSSGGDSSNYDDLWFIDNEGTISYRRLDGAGKTLKVHWTAKVFYGSEFWD